MREAFLLPLSRSDHAFADLRRSLASFVAGNFAEFHLRHFDVQINPVQQRAGNSAEIILDFARRTFAIRPAFFRPASDSSRQQA